MTKINQCVQALIDKQVNTTTVTTIATIRPTTRHKFLATETQATVASVPCLDLD
jgi:hypothetical protein